MKRPCALLLSLPEAEALALLLARHKAIWRVICHDLAIAQPEELEERIIEAHRAGMKLLPP